MTDIRTAITEPPPPEAVEALTLESALDKLDKTVGTLKLVADRVLEHEKGLADSGALLAATVDRLGVVQHQAESALSAATKAGEAIAAKSEKIDRTYDQLHALCKHLGVPILGEEAQPDAQRAISVVPDRR